MPSSSLDERCVNTLRFLAADAVEEAGSGHPGMPLGAAPMAYVLWDRFLKHNPNSPEWPNRDRFVLSAGHGSALLYALLHLYGYDLPLAELKNFRQLHSKTPGHPEYGHTPGVETTTGPLGQGFANGVGMALAERYLSGTFNTKEHPLIDHYTYGIVSDGDLMEGLSAEAGALAGHLGLGKLIYLYDQNCISIEGETDLAFTERVASRFDAQGWHVQHVEDGNALDDIEAAVDTAQDATERPSLICVHTHIGYGSSQQDTAGVHGSPLGDDDLAATKEHFGWPTEPRFHVPEDAYEHCRRVLRTGAEQETAWQETVEAYREAHPDSCRLFLRAMEGEAPEYEAEQVPTFQPEDGSLATRNASGETLQALADNICTLVGGSADLAPSNKTHLEGYGTFQADQTGRNLHFGVREHAMGAITSGMSLHGGLLPFDATFFTFSDYMRPALRLAALMDLHRVTVFTHDSIAIGEDGPTHQPVEHLMAMRSIPNYTVLRPADANETAAAWQFAVKHDGPVGIVLTRQDLPVLDPARVQDDAIERGAYVLQDTNEQPDVVLLATGSEVHLALDAAATLDASDRRARVISMPSMERFEEQPDSYRHDVLPPGVPTVAVEAGTTRGWHHLVGDDGAVIGLDRFGLSGPGEAVYEELGFTVDHVVNTVHAVLKDRASLAVS
ncbi:transketolase [Salinibacter ruber]|uniref:transketolase n=1 Tax=Salinibacter ruber TaxID=146919 RepID=UPI002168A8A6|nr:transketolase [Salinibacter ruber]MCS3698325.1 transketolase [Salinibacter ruber]